MAIKCPLRLSTDRSAKRRERRENGAAAALSSWKTGLNAFVEKSGHLFERADRQVIRHFENRSDSINWMFNEQLM